MKIDLERPKQRFVQSTVCQDIPWIRGKPFLHNPRGYLIHRVRSAHSHMYHGEWSHDTADYWCGNFGRGEFVNEPPADRLLCAVCEANAVAHGKPTAEELIGRHVCIGRLRAVRLCCKQEAN